MRIVGPALEDADPAWRPEPLPVSARPALAERAGDDDDDEPARGSNSVRSPTLSLPEDDAEMPLLELPRALSERCDDEMEEMGLDDAERASGSTELAAGVN